MPSIQASSVRVGMAGLSEWRCRTTSCRGFGGVPRLIVPPKNGGQRVERTLRDSLSHLPIKEDGCLSRYSGSAAAR